MLLVTVDNESKKRAATRATFFLMGVTLAMWAPLVPYAKARLNVDEAVFGLLLLCLGIGAVLCMPMCQRLVVRFGCRKVICAGGGR
jgi:predicted MFS family arabinose efflux permease